MSKFHLVALILLAAFAVVVVAAVGGAYLFERENYYPQVRDRFHALDRASETELRDAKPGYRERVNHYRREQNDILRAWPGHFPGRTEQPLLELD